MTKVTGSKADQLIFLDKIVAYKQIDRDILFYLIDIYTFQS